MATAGEIKANLRIFYDSGYYQIAVEVTMDKNLKATKISTKDFREPDTAWSKLTLADLKRKIGGKILQTKPGGTFLGTLAKKPCKDSDSLESCGAVVDKKALKHYDFAFDFDPDLDPARYHTENAPASNAAYGSAVPLANPRTVIPSDLEELQPTQLLMEISVTNENGKYHVTVDGKSKRFNPSTELKFGSEFESLRMGDFLEKLGSEWPAFERQGTFIGPKEREPFTARSKLDIIGISCKPGKTETFKCVFDIDPGTKATTSAPTTSASTTSASTSTESSTPSLKSDQLLLSLQVTPSGSTYTVSARGTSDQFKKNTEISVKSSEWKNMTIDDLLAKLGSQWPTFQFGGFFVTSTGKKAFMGDDKLTSHGIEAKTQHQLVLDIASLPSTSSQTQTHTAKKEKLVVPPTAEKFEWEGPPNLTVELRLFEDSGYQYFTIKSEESHFTASSEFALKDSEYKKLTIDAMFSKLGAKWPKFKEGGLHVTPTGKKMFMGDTKLVDLGIVSDPKRTVSHQLALEVDLNASPRPSAAAVTAAAINAANAKIVRPEQPATTATQETGFIADDELGIEIRIFCDSGNHFASITGKATEFSQRAEITLSDRDWQSLTWGQFKEKLIKFPGTYDGGEFLSSNGKKKFTNRDTLYATGVKGDKSKTVSFQCLFKLDGTAPVHRPRSSSSSTATPAPSTSSSISPRAPASTATSTTSQPRKTSTGAHTRKVSATANPSMSVSDVINCEIRLFVNSGIYELQVQASGAHKGTVEVSIPADKFGSFTMGDLRKRFGSKWPTLKPGGTMSSRTGSFAFTESQTLREIGIDVRDNSTKTFDIVLNVAS